MIMDDLSVEPMSAISGVTLLNKFKVQNVGGLEERVVSLDEKMVCLLCSYFSNDFVLSTDFIVCW